MGIRSPNEYPSPVMFGESGDLESIWNGKLNEILHQL
jgi:hypothetical protein